jgi:hypothetical protein
MQNFKFSHKLVIIVRCPLYTKGQGTLDHGGGELVGENFMVGQIFEELAKEESEAYTMDERKHSKPSSPNWKPWCVIDSKHSKCAPIIGWKQLEQLWCAAQSANQKIQSHPKHD